MREVLVVGGGAAGMMAALTAAEAGAAVTLIERNEKTGKKVYITGKGRCNLTNDCDRDTFLREVPRNPRFLFSALEAFSPQDMMALMESSGCPVIVQRGRRVFPASEHASDVIRALTRRMDAAGVRVMLHTRCASLWLEDGALRGAVTGDGRKLAADAVILATGGLSYPATGSDGDGYRLARQAGHTVLPASGVLNAVETEDAWCGELMGLSLRNVTLTLREGKKVRYSELGEMLFTHFGISGPLVLEMSCHLPEDISKAAVTLDLKPGLTPEQVDARLVREFAANPRRQIGHVMEGLLPARLAERFPALSGVDGAKTASQISHAERQALAGTLKALPIRLKRLRPVDEAVVTRGGVSVKEVQPATMESRLLPGLYFAGELLDVDAHTGGYNLQIAWSTGRAAGLAAAQE